MTADQITETEGWVDETTGYHCRAVFSRWWCGYVEVPWDHPWHKVNYSGSFCGHDGCRDHSPEMEVNVHGGLTFSGVPAKESEGHWFGFDCAHLGDFIDYGVAGVSDREGHRWTLSDVRNECARLASQLAAHADDDPNALREWLAGERP